MIDPYLRSESINIRAMVDRIVPDVLWVTESAERVARFAHRIEATPTLDKNHARRTFDSSAKS
jgi:hypothetical protein